MAKFNEDIAVLQRACEEALVSSNGDLRLANDLVIKQLRSGSPAQRDLKRRIDSALQEAGEANFAAPAPSARRH